MSEQLYKPVAAIDPPLRNPIPTYLAPAYVIVHRDTNCTAPLVEKTAAPHGDLDLPTLGRGTLSGNKATSAR